MATDYDLDAAQSQLDRLLDTREYPKTLCPSEVARALSTTELSEAGASSWRDLMPALRAKAFELRDAGIIEILQRGQVLPLEQGLTQTTGPIRIRKARECNQ